MTTIPTSRDVGYKYLTVFDGSRSMHELVELDLFAECLLKIARDARISEPELFKPHFVKPTE